MHQEDQSPHANNKKGRIGQDVQTVRQPKQRALISEIVVCRILRNRRQEEKNDASGERNQPRSSPYARPVHAANRSPPLNSGLSTVDPFRSATIYSRNTNRDLRITLLISVYLCPSVVSIGFQHPSRNHKALDFARSLVDFRDTRVAIHALDRILAAVAVAAVNLHGFVRDAR